MDKKNQLIVTIFLVIVAVAVVMVNLKIGIPGASKKGAVPPSAAAKVKPQDKLPSREPLMALLKEDADDSARDILLGSKWGDRNPFDERALKAAQVVAPVVGDRNFVLGGIVSGKITPSSIINDKVVGVGDKINGVTVKTINEGVVTLSDGQKDILLKIRKP